MCYSISLANQTTLLSSVVILEESPCRRGLICKSLSLSLSWITKSLSLDSKLLENFRGLHAFLKQSLCENFQRKVGLESFPYLTVYRDWR